MTNKVKTMEIKGNEYAKVVERLKQFREDCPNGLIETKPEFQPDGQILFSARILKDKSDKNSAEGTGHALGNAKGDKAFEKLETIAVGRALAMLGYMASGEIASSEEMEEFNKYKEEKIDEAIGRMKQAETLEELKTIFMSLGSLMANSKIIEAKDARKEELNEKA
jgi:hypothetical protein